MKVDNPLLGVIEVPDWAERGLRPHQTDAVVEILGHYADGVNLVVLDAPTGSGKTLIAEVVRRKLGVERSSYVCHGKALQDQFADDFVYANVAKGRNNYPTVYGGSRTADDCSGEGCELCPNLEACPYQIAKVKARDGELACVNTTFLLTACRGAKWYKDFIVLDECDTLESEVLKWATITIGNRWCERVGMAPPAKGAHRQTIQKWLRQFVGAARRVKVADPKQQRAKQRMLETIERMIDEEWVREYGRNVGLELKPLWATDHGSEALWEKGEKFLLMSGSVVDAEELVMNLGWKEDFRVVSVPMTFPEENRLIYYPPSGQIDMSYKNKVDGWRRAAAEISDLCQRHPEAKVLVHGVSYPLSEYLRQNVVCPQRKLTYKNAKERDGVLELFRYSDGAIVFAPSFDRGVDLPDVDIVVIPKVPYPNLKDKVVSEKLHSGREGQLWYDTQTIRTLLQMSGRHVRSKTDVGKTVVLDKNFRRLMRNRRRMFPAWWRESVRHQEI